MARIRAVGFDLDGTLFDHRGSARAGVDAFVASLGVAPSDAVRGAWSAAEREQFEHWRAGRIGFAEQRRRRLRQVLPGLGVSTPTDDAGLDALFDRYLDAYRGAWRAFSDSADELRRLRHDGYRLGILTNGSDEQQRDKLHVIGLTDLVDVICTSEGIGVTKPDARAFHHLAGELGVEPSACLFVGDDPEHDVAGARASGMSAVLVDRGADDGEHALAGALASMLRPAGARPSRGRTTARRPPAPRTSFAPARPADERDVRAFLTEADLTLAGLDAPGLRLWLERDSAGTVVGSTGFELSADGEHALVRSVAVASSLRADGAGTRLATHALAEAAAAGAERAWLFSLRSGPFWQKLGFVPADRDALAGALADTHQVQLFRATGQFAREVAWTRPLDDLRP